MVSKLASFPASLPTAPIAKDVDATKISGQFAQELGNFTEQSFVKDALWRDTFALTGTQRTFYSASSIATAWAETAARAKATTFSLNAKSARVTRLPNGASWIDVPFTFETEAEPKAVCFGVLAIVPGDDGWKIWILRTILEQINGFGDVDHMAPKSESVTNGVNGYVDETVFDAVVVGAGHAGLSVGGRLQALGLKYVVLEKNRHAGDSWKNRYGSVKLHTKRAYSHLPFDRTFPEKTFPREWLTKDDLAEGYQNWVEKFRINIWLKTRLLSGKWDESTKRWSLIIEREGEAQTIETAHLVLAIGAGSQTPITPNFANEEVFKGVKMHSVDYSEPSQWKGKHGIIIGTANTAHDVAEDMVAAGLASVTMVQRSRTYVLPVEYYQNVQVHTYNEHMPTELADKLTSTGPLAISRLVAMVSLNSQAAQQPERFDALERAGFRVERFGDLIYTIFERMGGHYIEVGASAKIADGRIKVKSDALAVRYREDGLEFDDGTVLPADVIVFATGFRGNLRDDVRELLGDEVADRITDFWGLDDEGEPRGAYRPTGHPALWLHGTTLGVMRFYSRFIALQIKAALQGVPLRMYDRKFTQ